MIKLKNVSKFYYSKGVIATGFTKVNLEFNIGEFVAITGESGSGKSTLLNVISGLDSYEEGEMYINNHETSHYMPKDWENYIRENIGNIYQNFNLINSYTVYQNVDLILSLNGIKKKERKEKILSLLKRVDMLKYKNTKVSKLSGGQKQRVSIARALAKDVPIIIADEPTGSLDKNSADNIIKLLREISNDKLVIIVTHNYEQVSDYVSRKITMSDGRIVSDVTFKKVDSTDSITSKKYKYMSLFEVIKLGIRNTFNVFSKFVLLMIVYSFIVCALMSEYSMFKKTEYETSKLGYNAVFVNQDDKRIVLNKKDKSLFSDDEINSLKKMSNVKSVVENDLVLDEDISFIVSEFGMWISGGVYNINTIDSVDFGRMPENDYEIVVETYKDDFMFGDSREYYIDKDYFLANNVTGDAQKDKVFKVVGVKYLDEDSGISMFVVENYKFYVSDLVLKDVSFSTHKKYSNIKVDFMGQFHDSSEYSNDFQLEVNDSVSEGMAYISEDFDMYCDKYNCLNKTFFINSSNHYFDSSLELVIDKKYNSKNINSILKLDNYSKEKYEEFYNGKIYINSNDYNSLFNRGTYQISIFVDDIEKIDTTFNKLKDMGYNPLKIKDTIVADESLVLIKIFRVLVTIILVVVLFFISYFIIKIILKSRNIYFSTIRMLGGSRKVCKWLLIVELFVISNLSYFLYTLIVYLERISIIKSSFIEVINTYFKFNDYIVLYLIITLMSLFISMRYARKLFVDSAMNTYREEV